MQGCWAGLASNNKLMPRLSLLLKMLLIVHLMLLKMILKMLLKMLLIVHLMLIKMLLKMLLIVHLMQ